MKKILFILLFASCTGPFRDKKVYEPVDSSQVDPIANKDTLEVDSVQIFGEGNQIRFYTGDSIKK